MLNPTESAKGGDMRINFKGENMNGIWIRSQNKKSIVFASHIYMSEGSIPITYLYAEYGENGIQLGKYMTEQRALEVLGEIQSWIYEIGYSNFIKNFDIATYKDFINPVYEMPLL